MGVNREQEGLRWKEDSDAELTPAILGTAAGRYGGTRTLVGVDIYNLTDADVVTSYVPGGAWLRPTAIQPARYARISAQIDF